MSTPLDLAIIGGCGHVGLPLGLAFADRGLRVELIDIDAHAVELVNGGRLPFTEPGAQEVLTRVRAGGLLEATTDPSPISQAETVVVVIGTPIDEHLNPDLHAVHAPIEEIATQLVPTASSSCCAAPCTRA